MQYPKPQDSGKYSLEMNAEFLKTFRTHLEGMSQEIINRFGHRPEAVETITKLIEARMWSGNLFGYCDVEDLNRKRDDPAKREQFKAGSFGPARTDTMPRAEMTAPGLAREESETK